jgi:hypothetical protein
VNDTLDVQTIAQRVALSPRKIRYVLEQRMLPGLRGRAQKHLAGQPRSFTRMEAFFIGGAAVLLRGGAQRKTVTEVLARLADMPWPLPAGTAQGNARKARAAPRFGTAVEAVYCHRGEPALVLIGDGVNLRLRLGEEDTGWLEPRSLARLEGAYRPAVVIQLDLAPLQTAFGPSAPG